MYTHKEIGYIQRLFHLDEDGWGPYFHPKGKSIVLMLEEIIRDDWKQSGYQEIQTPMITSCNLLTRSGHMDKFGENIYQIDDSQHALKPMSCPLHASILGRYPVSEKELPVRYAEFGRCCRKESSGSLLGMMRSRTFTQDDGHIFATKEQILEETVRFCDSVKRVYGICGVEISGVYLSTRPEKYIGSIEAWNEAEKELALALDKSGITYKINPGEGAFYGPKIEFIIRDANNKEWQCGTIQLDFNMPERLDIFYTTRDGIRKHPVMIHRAILGSVERFLSILIESTQGKLPFILSPVHVVVMPLNEESIQYSKFILSSLEEKNIRCIYDSDITDHINNRIKNAVQKDVPFYILVIGDKEVKSNTVSIRDRSGTMSSMSHNDFINKVCQKE